MVEGEGTKKDHKNIFKERTEDDALVILDLKSDEKC